MDLQGQSAEGQPLMAVLDETGQIMIFMVHFWIWSEISCLLNYFLKKILTQHNEWKLIRGIPFLLFNSNSFTG